MRDMVRPNERHLSPPRRDPVSGKWVYTLPDSEQQDVIVMDVSIRHRDSFEDFGYELQRAGALYKYMSSDSEYRMHFNPDDTVAEIVARLAEDATNLLLDWRRENHEHTKVVVSRPE